MLRLKERKLVSFTSWGPADFNVAVAPLPAGTNSSRVNGLLLANHSGISSVLILHTAGHLLFIGIQENVRSV